MTYELATWIIGITVAVMVLFAVTFTVMLKVELGRAERPEEEEEEEGR
jgi:flagellar biosynthesis/type III secretory pathway M-ring protein FliF/YscJ